VTPWPYPSAENLPDLEGGGIWNTEGWVGAVLDAAAVVGGSGGTGEPAERAERFLASAVAACRTLLTAP